MGDQHIDPSRPFAEVRVPATPDAKPARIGWRVTDGQRVTPEQVLMELETEKAVFEIEAFHAGRVELLVEKYAEAEPGQLIARIWTS